MDSAHVPGLALAVLGEGKVIYAKTYGVIHAETKDKVNVNSVFEAASLSKPVFAYTCLKLTEAGVLDLDKPLHAYLPYQDIAYDSRYKKITARMVLSHASGFPNWRNNDSLRIQFEPGQRFSYSGEGYVYLQKVVEKLTGKPLNELVTEKVFKPLGMTRSSYVWREEFDHNMASPHDEFGKPMGKNRPSKANAASSLHTTASDYAAFVAALLNQTGLQTQSIVAMLTTQMQVPQDRLQPNAERAKDVSWGLGVGLQKTGEGKSFWHWGDNYTFKCYVVAYPETKSGVVYFTNSVNGLSIARPLLRQTVGGAQPALAFLGYEEYNTPSFLFKKNLLTQAAVQAIQPFLDEQGKSTIKESQMHQIGHLLIKKGKVQQAKEVFTLNQQAYPQSPYVYEDYGFACLVNGELTEAAQNYQKSLKLKPDNQEAATIYKGILASQAMKGNTELRLKGYPGAKLVSVAGSFNNWFPFATFFVKQGQQWVCNFELPPGQYQYKLIVDGQWMLDPANPATAQEKGHTNSLLIVK